MGEEPDEESEEDYEEEEEIGETAELTQTAEISGGDVEKRELPFKELHLVEKSVTLAEIKTEDEILTTVESKSDVKYTVVPAETTISAITPEKKIIRNKISKKKPGVELFEEIDVIYFLM